MARPEQHLGDDIPSTRSVLEQAWCSTFKDATARPHPGPFIDTGAVTHRCCMDSPRDSDEETAEEGLNRFSSAVTALQDAANATCVDRLVRRDLRPAFYPC